MQRNLRQFARAYESDALEARVLGANPAELVEMLYAGAIGAIRAASLAIEAGEFTKKAAYVNKALDIISGLDVTLDHARGGEISANLAALYDYAKRRMMEGSASNDRSKLEEVVVLLETVREAWEELGRQQRAGGNGLGSSHGAITV
ncbi:flagellar export chaperone FliS [Laribacter hongkongensis]|uniref:flagellar export chaperone FliS n=1 Tax=Laribacter hongkongensis TaxID=168471 RepID=UPI001EFDB73D|nr:flagellar export chaperone FliS [Laribacter hongkongensis]MCG9042293.1 flagellar export chaperone FliS [Laribacter hongkongensis]MCG9056928.1 flagellar export chaperone FliS [Laribacter hongkongensis]MCG9069038.1 flagellar export chaperone FliS [Laribacter hongkongensis]